MILVPQVYDAVLSAASTTTVELAEPGTVANASTPHGRLLNSNLYDNAAAYSQTPGSSSGTLEATLFALNMEFSSGVVRNELQEALIGVHFAHLVPENLTDHIHVELDDGVVLDSQSKRMVHVPGNAQGQLVAVTVPSGYSGQVCLLISAVHGPERLC